MVDSSSLTDELMGQLQGAPMQGLAQQLGVDSVQTEQAVGLALPMLFGALGQNASQPQGAADLLGALKGGGGGMDLGGLLGGLLGNGGAASAGGLGSILGSVLGGGAAGQGSDAGAILGQVFGAGRQKAESQLGQATGLGGNAGQLLTLLAPIVMSFLAQRVQAGGMSASDLGQTLGKESSQIQAKGGAAGGLLGSLLDQNGDGKLDMGDLIKLGTGLLGKR
ncbi:DUF937 domain-containing protein [Comamonas composti]|uniref:DUF937 domain-containing protein n=1 Tax=Comamonas composti TaxID=408558 RepID=UPI0003F70242|nr:DUF937 domain-containing protein [Comamonas composti]